MPPRIRRRITTSKKEEIEKEQELLSRSIVRPFDILNNLPVTFSQPNVEVLKQPLTVKDSGVLYRSLLKSRSTYLQACPMFQLYWVKQSSYIKKLMDEGKPIPKNLKKDDTVSERKTILSNDVNARDIMVKLVDCGLNVGPHTFDVRIFIAKDSRSDTKEDKLLKKKEKEEKKKLREKEKAILEEERKKRKLEKEKEKEEKEKEKLRLQFEKKKEDERRQKQQQQQQQQLSSSMQSKRKRQDSNDSKQKQQPSSKKAKTAQTPSTPNMQTDENQIMINNLNYIASLKTSLNELMRIVASGEADSQQILEFQRYIKLAKDLGPPPHKDEEIVVYLENMSVKPIQNEKSKEKKPPKEKKTKGKDIIPKEQKLTAFQELYSRDATLLFEFVENSNTRFMIPKYSICEVCDPSTMINSEDGDASDNKDLLFSFLWLHNQVEVNEYEKKLEEYNRIQEEERLKEEEKKKEEEQKLKEEEQKLKEEEQNKEKSQNKSDESEQTEELSLQKGELNQNDETESDLKSTSQNDEKVDNNREGEADDVVEVKSEETTNEINVEAQLESSEPTTFKRRGGSKGRKKKGPPPRKNTTPKEIKPPVEPEYRYTSVSFTLHGIPSKLIPIFINSVKPIEEVQKYMKHILEVGTRASSFYLWYQVDGKLDEKLAEEIRSELVIEEKKMVGIPTIQEQAEPKKYPKKKKAKEEQQDKKIVKLEETVNV